MLWQRKNALDIHSQYGIIKLIKPITNTVRTTAMPCHGCSAAAAFALLLLLPLLIVHRSIADMRPLFAQY
jgi:hypothetical protein